MVEGVEHSLGHDHGLAADTGELQPHVADNLRSHSLRHGFFTRQGGVSGGIYHSLNCGRGSKDNRADVEENRARVGAHFNVAAAALIGPRQAHTARVVLAEAPWLPHEAPEADGVVTTATGLAIGILSADCAPVLLADAEAGVIGAVHAGWKGAKAGVIEAAIDVMEGAGARRERIAAAIGPAISADAYEVGPEFRDAFIAATASNAAFFNQKSKDGRPYFDLPCYIEAKLRERTGIVNILNLGLCTYQNESIFFSHRRSVHRGETDYGRQISAILLT